MLLFSQRLKLRDMFYEWADKERFGQRTDEHFFVYLLSNGLIDEERALKFIEKNNPKEAACHEKPTA